MFKFLRGFNTKKIQVNSYVNQNRFHVQMNKMLDTFIEKFT